MESANGRGHLLPKAALLQVNVSGRADGLLRRVFETAVRVACEAGLLALVHRGVFRPGPPAEPRGLVILERLLEFLTGVHHERAMLGHGFGDGFTLQQ